MAAYFKTWLRGTFTLLASALLATTLLSTGAVRADDKVVFMTSWYAQAEHGGFYQALAKGIYKKYGLDVSIKMGGPQINGMQMLVANQADFLMSYDLQVLKSVEQGLPVVTVGTAFQYDPQGMMTHADTQDLGALKDKTILVSTSGRSTWWPWLKAKYGYSEAQARPYTFNLQPFFNDPNTVVQAYASSEPFQAQANGAKVKFFLFAKDGYPPYGSTIVSTSALVKDKPDLAARFVRASMEGWKSYLADPSAGNTLIKQDNPEMKDDQLQFAMQQMKALQVVTGGDAAVDGIGIMTDARWKKTADFMVHTGLLSADTDWHKAYTTQFVKTLKIMP